MLWRKCQASGTCKAKQIRRETEMDFRRKRCSYQSFSSLAHSLALMKNVDDEKVFWRVSYFLDIVNLLFYKEFVWA